MPLGNIVMLKPDNPERMHFFDHRIETRTITDPVTRQPKLSNVLVMLVDRLDGAVVNAQFSTLAETLYAKLEPYLTGKLYQQYEFIVTQRGTGFTTKYTVENLPYKAS